MTSDYKLAVIIIIAMFFSSCSCNKKNIQFSFEEIQTKFYQNLKDTSCFNHFYIPVFFNNIEKELNESIINSNCCSVLITSAPNSGKWTVCALYDQKKELYFEKWNLGEKSYKFKIQNPEAKKILKRKPKNSMTVDESEIHILDGTSMYIIKKIGKKMYYYANHYGQIDDDYKSLLDLLKNMNQM